MSQKSYAQEGWWDKLSDSLRPLVEKTLGEEAATRWFGPKDYGEVALPEIPEVIKDARSTKKRSELNQNTLSEEVWTRYNQRFVGEVFEAVRLVKPNSNDQAQWYNVLSQGGTQEGVYRGIILDQTYTGLENYPEDSSEALADFGVTYFKTYLNKDQTRERLKGVNFYSLKRILVENSLEIFEMLAGSEPDALYRWYAHLSGTLAQNHPEVFLDGQRANRSMLHHYEWAKAAPEQLIKAELIVKLHLVMNFLQRAR